MKYEELSQPIISALKELYFLELLKSKNKLPKNRSVDIVSISASVAPIKTSILPKEEKDKVEIRVKRFLEIK